MSEPLVKRVAKVTWHISARNDRSATEFVAISGRRDHLSFDMCYMWKRHLPQRSAMVAKNTFAMCGAVERVTAGYV